MMEVHNGRRYHRIGVECNFCTKMAVWEVHYDVEDGVYVLQVCEDHKFTAFS